MAEATPILDFQGVQITRHEHIIFEDFSLRLEAGEFVYLTGPVGVGKSTLLKTIYAEVPIKQGHAMVLGMDLVQVTRRTLPALRRRIGIVFQDFRLLPDLDVYNNLDIVLRAFGFGRGADRRARIQEVLQEVGLERKDYKYPHELSGGEQQRVCIARALIGGPDLMWLGSGGRQCSWLPTIDSSWSVSPHAVSRWIASSIPCIEQRRIDR